MIRHLAKVRNIAEAGRRGVSLKSTGLAPESDLWETIRMSKKKVPKRKATRSPKKRTPNQAAHTEAKQRKQQSKRIQQEFDGIGNMMRSTEHEAKRT
jgi:hypothetical protein